MIVPNTFLRATTYEDLRREVMGRYRIEEITDVGPDVFPGVTASTVIPIIKKAQPSPSIEIKALDRTGNARRINLLERARVLATSAAVLDLYADAAVNQIADKMLAISHPLSACTQHLISGIQTWKQHKSNFIASTRLTEDYKPLLEGKDIGRYALNFANKYILYDKKVLNVMQNESIFLLNEKILIQRVSGGPQPLRATLDRHSYYTFNSINTLVCRGLDNRYVLGLLNSTLVNWLYYNKFSNRSSLTVNIATKFLRQLPIRRIDFTNQQEKATHDRLVALVDRMLGLHQRLAAKGDLHDNEREQIEREIAQTDREIDDLVYDLYGLSAKERALIEAEVKR